MIKAEIIKDSTNWTGKRLTTFVLEYPRYIHSELMTHRVFSKNSASSRAIPYGKMKQNIENNTVYPIWTIDQKGMQGEIIKDTNLISTLDIIWENIKLSIFDQADDLYKQGVHKQNVNRLFEPWMYIRVILTGTDFENFFELRDHKDAQPEIQELAKKMKEAMELSVPEYLEPGEWHIPFEEVHSFIHGDLEIDIQASILNQKLKSSVARCARISYNNVDGSNSTIEKDLELFDKLITQRPLHASPAEHQARVPLVTDYELGHMSTHHSITYIGKGYYPKTSKQNMNYGMFDLITNKGKYVSNLQGWVQYRKILESGI